MFDISKDGYVYFARDPVAFTKMVIYFSKRYVRFVCACSACYLLLLRGQYIFSGYVVESE